jgi:hypothetical protein
MKLSIEYKSEDFLKNTFESNNIIYVPVVVEIKKTYNQKKIITHNWIIVIDRCNQNVKHYEDEILKNETFVNEILENKFIIEPSHLKSSTINTTKKIILGYKTMINNQLYNCFYEKLNHKISQTENKKSHYKIGFKYDLNVLREWKLNVIGL